MPDPYRLIVLANRTCPCPGLTDEIVRRLEGRPAEVLVVAPALNSRLRHLTNDDARAVDEARARLAVAVELLRAAGIDSRGEVGDGDPLNAAADAHATFGADAVLVSTWPEGSSHWLERDLPGRARRRLGVPVEHVVSAYDAPVPPANPAASS